MKYEMKFAYDKCPWIITFTNQCLFGKNNFSGKNTEDANSPTATDMMTVRRMTERSNLTMVLA
jgi:hypothetical protein